MWNGGISPPFFISALDVGHWWTFHPGLIVPAESAHNNHWIEDCADPIAGLDDVPGIEPGPSSLSLYRLSYRDSNDMSVWCYSKDENSSWGTKPYSILPLNWQRTFALDFSILSCISEGPGSNLSQYTKLFWDFSWFLQFLQENSETVPPNWTRHALLHKFIKPFDSIHLNH
jgi:hypothetical protein